MENINELLHNDVENPSSIVNLNDEFIILDNPVLSPIGVYPYKNRWIIATLCEEGYAQGKVNLRDYHIGANGFILILPGQVIGSSELSPDFKGKILLLSPRFADSVNPSIALSLTKTVEHKPYYVFPYETALVIRNYINLCKSLILMKDGTNTLEALQLLSKGFLMGMEAYLSHQEPLPKLSSRRPSDLAEAFLNLVEMEYRRHRDLPYYANRLCKSVKYLSRVIMESTGRKATDWIERCVVMDAKAQLVSSKRRISEISDDLGFPSQSFFGKYFKRVTGLSPKAYREQNQ